MWKLSPGRRDFWLVCTCAIALSAGCASSEEVLVSEPAQARAEDAGSAGFSSAGMDGSISLVSSLDGALRAGDAGSSDASGLSAEVCDGLDNDLDGVVDDVDLAHDGICDCLRIATLGVPGGSGKGNVFADWLNTRSNVPAVALAGATLTPELLAPFQVIVAQDLHTMGRDYEVAELDALEAWIRAGGGLMTLIGYATPSERTNANSILARFGSKYGDRPILPRTGASTVPVTKWLGPHPVVEGISRLGADNGYPVQGTGTTLAQEGGYDLLKVQEVGAGHLIAWGDEWITYDSEWSEHPDYQVARFWVNSLKWLTLARVCQVSPVFL